MAIQLEPQPVIRGSFEELNYQQQEIFPDDREFDDFDVPERVWPFDVPEEVWPFRPYLPLSGINRDGIIMGREVVYEADLPTDTGPDARLMSYEELSRPIDDWDCVDMI